MKRIYVLIAGVLLFCTPVVAQKRVIDAVNHSPVAAASILDAAGNMVGYTLSNGHFSEVAESAYPLTLCCIGYEQLVIERPENKTWEMIPIAYDLDEVVVVPVKRNILKQTFYVREYLSMCSECDTVNFFVEHMADRFVPTSKDAKVGGHTSLRILNSRHYTHFKMQGEDSVIVKPKATLPSMLTILDLNDDEVVAPESFRQLGNETKIYEEAGKSGMALIQKQNAQTFTTIEDLLAETKEHTASPLPLKLLGFTMEINQLYTTHAYRVNSNGIYLPDDLMEAGFVMEADGIGKFFRNVLKSEEAVVIRSMLELYVVDREFFSNEEAKVEFKNKPKDVKFVIPSTIPPLNKATQRLVDRANAEARK
ncbi:MAG: hypothetical protein IKV33_04835 [Alistipes sp.]|nr:hypothetical protein [Alistipes sp.]